MYALDANTLIYYFRDQGNVKANFIRHSPRELAIPTVVLFELEVGIGKSTAPQKRWRQLDRLVTFLTILPFDEAAAREAAQIRVLLEGQGNPIGKYDTLIAGTALANNATLITRNLREYSRVPTLQVINWY